MGLAVRLNGKLLEDERYACQRYESEATLLHAVLQHRSKDFQFHPDFGAFASRCRADIDAIDRAIAKFEVCEEGRVFSGHGLGICARGSLRGEPDKFVGFEYCYPGYTSTSSQRQVAEEGFIQKRAELGSSPVLLEFRLRVGMAVLDFSKVTTSVGEFEYLLRRSQRFAIVEATQYVLADVADPVLHLVMDQIESAS